MAQRTQRQQHEDQTDIQKVIRNVRPKLKFVSPLSYSIIWGFGIFNIALGLALTQLPYPTPQPTLVIINEIFGYLFWGVLFTVLGVLKLYFIKRNDWANIRRSLIIALLFKAIWLFAIIIQIFSGQGNIAILVIWIFITYIQASTYIHFVPNEAREYLDDRGR